jgi:hypothetical protein
VPRSGYGRRHPWRGGGRDVFRVVLAPEAAIDVDILFERQCGIQHPFHGLEPMGFNVAFDLARVAGRVFDDVFGALFLGSPEHHVVMGKVRVAEYMGGDQDVVGQAIAGGHIGAAGIAGEHHLEQA